MSSASVPGMLKEPLPSCASAPRSSLTVHPETGSTPAIHVYCVTLSLGPGGWVIPSPAWGASDRSGAEGLPGFQGVLGAALPSEPTASRPPPRLRASSEYDGALESSTAGPLRLPRSPRLALVPMAGATPPVLLWDAFLGALALASGLDLLALDGLRAIAKGTHREITTPQIGPKKVLASLIEVH